MSTERKERINRLVQDIQNGYTEKLHDLWDEVERLIAYFADKYANKGLSGITFDDLYQCGYLAMVKAAETHNGTDSFSHWLFYYYRQEVAALAGYRTKRQRGDPLHAALSLDAPLDDEEKTALMDTIQDPVNTYEDAERKIYIEQLREALNRQIDTIEPQCAGVIKERYFHNKTLQAIGNERGCGLEWVRQLENKGLRLLRKPWRLRELEQFIELTTPYYGHVSVTRFQNTHTSATENAVLYRERVRGNS